MFYPGPQTPNQNFISNGFASTIISSVSDTLGNSWNIVSVCSPLGITNCASIGYSLIIHGGSSTISANLGVSNYGAWSIGYAAASDGTPLLYEGLASGTGAVPSTSGLTWPTSSISVDYPLLAFVFVGESPSSGLGPQTSSAGTWTPAATSLGDGYECNSSNCQQEGYLTENTGSGTFSATANMAFNGASSTNPTYLVAAFVFGLEPIVVTVITACTLFELQCWWYPLLFVGLYAGFILLVSTWLQTSPRGKAHLFLSAVTMGSLVAVIFGIMSIAFPLLMLLLNSIIALRLRG